MIVAEVEMICDTIFSLCWQGSQGFTGPWGYLPTTPIVSRKLFNCQTNVHSATLKYTKKEHIEKWIVP